MIRISILFFILAEHLFALTVKWPAVIKKGLKAPVAVTTAPSDSTGLYIVEQCGRVMRFNGGKLSEFLNIKSEKVLCGGEMGLLSIAFHPKYGKPGPNQNRVFLNYTGTGSQSKTGRFSFISEFNVKTKKNLVLLKISQPFSNHNGGQLAFGPDGYLYIGMGDGGAGGDPKNHGQNKNTLLGAMLRIDINKKEGELKYGIPKDNPYVKGGGRKEIFAVGLRNPWRFSFDLKTGRLFAADVGQNAYEEINLIKKGKNYGWRVWEAKHCYDPLKGCAKEGYEPPIFEYHQQEGASVTGGYVYRGSAIPELTGVYIYGDYTNGQVWGLRERKGEWKREKIASTRLPISAFGQDHAKEILIVSHNGAIYRLTK